MTRLPLIAILGLSLSGLASAQTPADRTLARLRGLAGEWEGTLEWSGARTGSGKLKAVYHVSGYDSTVVEDLIMGSDAAPSMMSVYHLDGADLRMTHYCGAGNQPRLKASRIDEEKGVVQFAFVDATNLAARPAHVEAVELRFPAADRLVIEFTFTGGGQKSLEHIELQRTRREGPAKT
jgi:hypothetical protein